RSMVRNLIVAALVALAVTIYALIQCIQTPAREVRSISKPAWILAIILLPLIGAGLWFWLGRPQEPAPSPAGGTPSRAAGPSGPRQKAPDDDVEFLRNLETQRRLKAKADELKAREAELKSRESRQKPTAPKSPDA